jgi:hypothetical protein
MRPLPKVIHFGLFAKFTLTMKLKLLNILWKTDTRFDFGVFNLKPET